MTELSHNTQEWLKILGNFAPHVDEENSNELLMLGHTIEKIGDGSYFSSRWYMNAAGWRELAQVCQEVAQFLDARDMT